LKTNLPVSQVENVVPHGLLIVSKTDLKGNITYVNDAFVEMSGFTREELIGKNHNIVRHPDMPPSAFKWLWDTMHEGLPWRGIVKNRCKNGDHYWVKALASPIKENSKIIGYLSVRTTPSRNEISTAEALYKQWNETGAAIGTKYDRYKFANLSLNLKLQILIQPILFILLASATFFIYGHMKGTMVENAKQRADATAMQVIDTANMLMVTGMIGEPDNRKLMIKKIIEGQQLTSLKLIRTDQVVRQFGPGLPEEHLEDSLVKEVIEASVKQGKSVPYFTQTQIDGKIIFRAITPYIESHSFHGTDCLSCHTVAEGSSNGASDITLDLTVEVDKLQHFLVMLIASQIILQLFIFLVIQFSFKKFVVNPLKGVEKRFEEVIEGDLNANIGIAGRDEIGILFCRLQVMQSQIQVMLDEMSLAASIIMNRSSELNEKICEVSEHSSSQRNDIKKISGAMDDFSKSVMQVAQDANSSAGAAITSQELIEESNKKMDKTIQSTDKVVIAVRASSDSINNLKEAIKKIGIVSNAIKEIADQTNLLALNAAIEAARAGEQGRGFAVVADEVRKLAERTGMSTNDITNMVNNIQAVSQSVVDSMNEAIKEVEEEAVIVQENGEILKQVIETSRHVTENAQRIAAVSKDQSVASEGVSKSLENVAGLVNSNAQIAEGANLAAQELSKSAVALQSMINQLNRKP
jgi:PAS domain S-box-containing protein